MESSGGTTEVLVHVKNILKSLKDYSTLAWMHTVLDVLTVPGQLRLVFQRDEITVNNAVEALSTAYLGLVALTLCPGKNFVHGQPRSSCTDPVSWQKLAKLPGPHGST